MNNKKQDSYFLWRENHKQFYDFIYQNFLDWPATSIQWGPLIQQNSQYIVQRIYFSCKTDGIYNSQQNTWTNSPNYIVMANVQIPNDQSYFINDLKSLFNYDAAKKHPNIRIKQIIAHPGEITVIRSSPMNRKLLASKSDTNNVYIWTSQKYKLLQNQNPLGQLYNFVNTPELTLQTAPSITHNYALKFTPSLPRLISASGNKLELFDIDSQPSKRQLGSVLPGNVIRPLLTLEGHDGVQDIAFKNNQICVSGGQDKQIGIWDLRIGQMQNKITEIHENDINAVGCKNNYILSGGQQGRINLIDDRTFKVVQRFQTNYPVHSIQFNPSNNAIAIGKQHLSFYNLDEIIQTHKFEPYFVHYGLRGNIHEFDWNNESPMTIAQTYQDPEPESTSQGGIVHIYRPIDLFKMKKQEAKKQLKQAFQKMSPQQQKKLLESL